MRRSSRREDAAASGSKKRSARDTGGKFGASKRRDETHRRRTESSERPSRSRYYQSSRAALDETGVRPDAGGPSPFCAERPLGSGSPIAPFSPFSGSNPFADDTVARRLQLFWAVKDSKKQKEKKRLLEAASLSHRRQVRQLSDAAAAVGEEEEGEEEEKEAGHRGHVSLDMEELGWAELPSATDRAETVPRRSQARSRWSRLLVAEPPRAERGEVRLTVRSEAEGDPAAPEDVTEAGQSPQLAKQADFQSPSSGQARRPAPDPTCARHSQASYAGSEAESPGCCSYILTFLSYLLIVFTLPFSLCFCVKVVQEYERAVIFRLGRLLKGGARGPGIFFVLPCIDTFRNVDLRTVSYDVPPQEILSKDSVTVSVAAVIYFRVIDPVMAVTCIDHYSHSTRLLAATTLRNVLGTKSLADLLAERETISHLMQSTLDEATDPWGVKVERVEIKDVRLPLQLQRAMAAEAEATREARAKIIAAEGEHQSSRALREAADVISESSSALQLRYLQTLNTISAEKNSTIIFPLPIDILQHFMNK